MLGGGLTSNERPAVAVVIPAPNVTASERFDTHLEGHNLFHTPLNQVFPDKPNLVGPRFNASTCGECHFGNGKGAIKFSPRGFGSTLLIKVNLKGTNLDGSPKTIPGTPEQIQDHQVSGKSPYNIKLRWTFKKGTYPDGKKYELRRPYLTFVIPGVSKDKIISSLRMSPSIIGMGLLDAVPTSTLIDLSDPFDLNGDGITGRPNLVRDIASNTKKLGRFGFKAAHPDLLQQSAAALFHDMGVTNSLFNDTKLEAEMSDADLDKIMLFQKVGGVPKARDQEDAEVIAGKALFQQVNCSGCHLMSLKTGVSSDPELSNQEFHPFTDLLLHDMGPGLADKRAEFAAKGSEWRTTPLWGIGIAKDLADHKPGFLHDGRARTIEEAVLWHGGEAKNSLTAYTKLSESDRIKLLKFLSSL